ncbi:hypothetical protein CsSME_00020758 [Camellia sinensis var. sinensis]
MTRKVLSPMVACRRGCPCTKRKVSKVDEIVNRLKGKNKKASKVQARKLNFASMDGMQTSPCIDGTQESMYVPAQGSPMQMVDNIGSESLSHSGMVTNISSQSGSIASKFVELNIDIWMLNSERDGSFIFGFEPLLMGLFYFVGLNTVK